MSNQVSLNIVRQSPPRRREREKNTIASGIACIAVGAVKKAVVDHYGIARPQARFRHSLSTWANETTKDITVSQTMLRHAKPDTTAIYTHGNFDKALDAQRVYMLLKMKPASESTQ
jgi:hypothetical protein